MKVHEMVDELDTFVGDESEYEVVIEVRMPSPDDTLMDYENEFEYSPVRSVEWDHQNKRIILR